LVQAIIEVAVFLWSKIMKNIRFLAIGLALLLACLGVSCSNERAEQVHKPGIMKMPVTFLTKTEAAFPDGSPSTTVEQYAEDVTIEKGTLTCTADKGLFNKETGQMHLTGNVVIRTADGIKDNSR
jgi:lipopolysaccharide assembly outer membrane protein LptD (OstA)